MAVGTATTAAAAAKHALVDGGPPHSVATSYAEAGAAAPASDEWALSSNSLATAVAAGTGPAGGRETSLAPTRTLASAIDSSRLNASPSYLRKVMGELHSNERVPLWKEEMVERVKRQATSRQQRDSLAASAPPSARLVSSTQSERHTHSLDDTMSAASSRKALSVADTLAETGLPPTRNQAREIERKLFWYQDAIHEQELQQQLLEQKIRGLADELTQALDRRRQHPELKGVGAVHLEKELHKRQLRERNRLSRALQVPTLAITRAAASHVRRTLSGSLPPPTRAVAFRARRRATSTSVAKHTRRMPLATHAGFRGACC